MPYTQPRRTKRGHLRFAAYARTPDGKAAYVGTFDTDERAKEVATQQEAFLNYAEHDASPAFKARVTIAEFVPIFLSLHDVEPNTLDNYRSLLTHWLIPALGKFRVSEVERSHIRTFLMRLKEKSVPAQTRKHLKAAMSAMFRMAWGDGYRDDNPVDGLPCITVTRKPILVLTMKQFGRLWPNVQGEPAQLFFRLMNASGMRMGELTPLKVSDWHAPTNTVTVSKSLAVVTKHIQPNQERFSVRDYTKNGTQRRVQVSVAIGNLINEHIKQHGLTDDDLIFPAHLVAPRSVAYRRTVLTEEQMQAARQTFIQAENGRTYAHGTVNAYEIARCRCDACRQERSEYSRRKRAERGLVAKTRHDPRDNSKYVSHESLNRLWRNAYEITDLTIRIPIKNLRHGHANALLGQGWTPDVISARLGNSEKVLQKHYLCYPDEYDTVMLGDLDELDALAA
ncbi:tyrosine-type recombinase/integrase [Streptosporangium sp. NPDC050855]|uniref:tyrosine-type recombinase/integrase n=1 Tax=Streptosporangium sp. NPDC050855 TaxID=3366194 RepID=UPI0037BD4A8B